ncbi:MAG: restriction endonuclease subunit S [Rhodocyclaceae bacterium]|nr:restriction endonuclease subunit S [Rhodocyclaceae bacterium]
MSSEWVPFTDLLSTIVDNRGRTCPVGDSGVPLIATNCIDSNSLYPRYDTTRFVSDDTYHTWFRGHPKPGDILFVCKGSPGRTNWVPNPVDFCIAQDMVSVRADPKKIYPKYLFAALRSSVVQTQIDNMHVGTMIPHFKKGDFGKLNIPVPSRDEQRVIGDFYFFLSERIALLRETNATLVAIAQALFKSWFVEFDPVRAKMEGRSPEGMDEATAALFPDSFEESELGLVPRGWRVSTIGETVETVGGATPDTKDPSYWEPAEHAWTTPKDLSGISSPVLLDTERKVSTKGIGKISSGLQPAGTLLMSSRAPIGYLAIAQKPVAINQGYIAMPPGSKLPPLYMLFWCQQNMDTIKNHANGSTFMEISKKAFRPLPILVPAVGVLEKFVGAAGALFDRLVENECQAKTLADLRDTLLPRLISGQLRLPNIC